MAKQSPAWLLEPLGLTPCAVAEYEIMQYLNSAPAYPVPFALRHCNSAILWQDQLVPLMNTGPLAGDYTAVHGLVVLAFQNAPSEPLQYLALAIRKSPVKIMVSDEASCELPKENSDLWQTVAKSCFRHEDIAIPIVDIKCLYSASFRDFAARRLASIPLCDVVVQAGPVSSKSEIELKAPEAKGPLASPVPNSIATVSKLSTPDTLSIENDDSGPLADNVEFVLDDDDIELDETLDDYNDDDLGDWEDEESATTIDDMEDEDFDDEDSDEDLDTAWDNDAVVDAESRVADAEDDSLDDFDDEDDISDDVSDDEESLAAVAGLDDAEDEDDFDDWEDEESSSAIDDLKDEDFDDEDPDEDLDTAWDNDAVVDAESRLADAQDDSLDDFDDEDDISDDDSDDEESLAAVADFDDAEDEDDFDDWDDDDEQIAASAVASRQDRQVA